MDTLLNAAPQVYRLKYKRLLTALVLGLLLRILVLANDGMLDILSTERRIILILIALRFLLLLRENIQLEKPDSQPRDTRWQAQIPLFFFMIPLMVMLWLAAWSTGGQLHKITSYAIAVTAINLLLIVNLVIAVVRSAKRASAEDQVVMLPYTAAQFLMDILFYGVFGLIFAVGMIGLMVLSPEVLDDIITIGVMTFNIYLLIWGVQGVFWFFSNLLRQTAMEKGLRQ